MRQYFVFLLFTLNSCHFPAFIENYNNTGVNFSKGKWLLNEINAPANVNEKLTQLTLKDFNILTKRNLEYSLTSKKVILRKIKYSHIPFDELKIIKKETNFDFFINLNVYIINDYDIKNSNKSTFGDKRSVSIILEIYDLNNFCNIYRQQLRGFIKDSDKLNDRAINFATKFIIIKGYKKIIRDITKKSIKK
jgi:hypothetical protein